MDEVKEEAQKSQLPFGFDVVWYLWTEVTKDIGWLVESQLPFGFDVVWYVGEFDIDLKDVVESQLPFGFDVVWYR